MAFSQRSSRQRQSRCQTASPGEAIDFREKVNDAMFHRSWKLNMTASEKQRGLVFILLYMLVFPRLSEWLQRRFAQEDELLLTQTNVVYYGVLFALALLAFWNLLKKDFSGLLDWLPENLTAIVAGVVLGGGARLGMEFLPLPVRDPAPLQYAEQFHLSPGPTLVLILLLIPLVEETVYRGYIYGHLREYSRPLAVVLSTLLYAFFQVWRYALSFGDMRYLLLILLYLPSSLALTLCYESAGSIWGCTLLHAGLNAVQLFALGM